MVLLCLCGSMALFCGIHAEAFCGWTGVIHNLLEMVQQNKYNTYRHMYTCMHISIYTCIYACIYVSIPVNWRDIKQKKIKSSYLIFHFSEQLGMDCIFSMSTINVLFGNAIMNHITPVFIYVSIPPPYSIPSSREKQVVLRDHCSRVRTPCCQFLPIS